MSGGEAARMPGRAVVLGELLPATAVREVAVVVAAALLTVGATLIRIPLPFSPVPITGGTLAVLLTGAALGPLRAVTAQGLFLLLILPLPFYAGGSTGVELLAGTSGGYLLSFPLASAAVGALARRGWDRTVRGTAGAFLLGSAVIYAVGLPWLAVAGGYGPAETVLRGLAPFIPGDTVKAVLAAGALPSAWRLVGHRTAN